MQIIKETSGNFKYEKMLKFKKAVFIYLPPLKFRPAHVHDDVVDAGAGQEFK